MGDMADWIIDNALHPESDAWLVDDDDEQAAYNDELQKLKYDEEHDDDQNHPQD